MKKLNKVVNLEKAQEPIYLYATQLFASPKTFTEDIDRNCCIKMIQTLNANKSVKYLVK